MVLLQENKPSRRDRGRIDETTESLLGDDLSSDFRLRVPEKDLSSVVLD